MNISRLYYPAFFILLIISSFSYVDFAVTALLLLIAGLMMCRSVLVSKEWKTYKLTKLMLAYLAWLFVVALSSAIPNSSMVTLSVLAGLPLTYLAATHLSNYAEVWKILQKVLFVLAVMLACWAIWQVVNHIGYGFATGPLLDRNAFAALINLLWFPVAYLFISSSSASIKSNSSIAIPKVALSALLAIGLFIISTALFATTSRGGIATWLLLTPIFLWATYKFTHSKLLVLAIPIIALSAYLFSSHFLHSTIAERTFQLAQDGSTHARLQMWQSTIKMALDHPFIGTGWGTFGYIYPAYRLEIENTTSGFFAHNDYLQFAAEGGLPALLLLIGMLIALLFQLKRNLNHANQQSGMESVALTLGVLALFIHAGVNFIFYFAFLNIVSGFYLARVAQQTESPRIFKLSSFDEIRPSVKYLLGGTLATLIAAPFAIHITTQLCLTGSMPGMRAINLIAPKVNAFDVAKLITAVRPAEGLAQEYVMQTYEYYLTKDPAFDSLNANNKHALLLEAVERFDSVRKREANNPRVGSREVKLLMQHHDIYGTDDAYAKVTQILNANLKVDPFHANSMISLSRLQLAEGKKADAINTLQGAIQHVLTRRDEQLITLESIRQAFAPKVIIQLDEIEEQLHQVRSDSETGKASQRDSSFYDNVDAKLNLIASQLKPMN